MSIALRLRSADQLSGRRSKVSDRDLDLEGDGFGCWLDGLAVVHIVTEAIADAIAYSTVS